MNRIYRLVWSEVRSAWVAVAENTRGRGKASKLNLVAVALSLTAVVTQAAPIGGQVASGAGSIAHSGSTTTIKQSSPNLSLNWKSFNIAPQETVNFMQPSASSIAVNRIYDTNGTQILGHLNANGQVYLINPNGILFGQGAQVNVGGLVASTLDLHDASLNNNARSFSGNGTGSVVNRGVINAANGGYVALLGNHVGNEGSISAQSGTVALGAGSAATLTFQGSSLVRMQVDQSVLNSVAENGGLIHADGGMVVMTAGAKDALLASVVNNTGVIEARTVENRAGTITLLGGMTAGTVNVGGTLDASAPNGGHGGHIETSAAHVKIANGARITTAASMGLTGSWLIDPQDFTVAASGGDITGTALSSALGSSNVEVQSNAGGTSGSGNVNVNDALTWGANTTLTLTASNSVNINASITATGNAAGLVISPNTANGAESASGTGTLSFNNGASVTLSGTNPSLVIAGTPYTVINSLGAPGSTTGTDLQGMNGSLAGYYALGSNIDATATSGWNAGAGFVPIGNSGTPFTGIFVGLGHVISDLTINAPTVDNVGFIGYALGASVQDLGLVNAHVTGKNNVGALFGAAILGMTSRTYATGQVNGQSDVGGLVGYDNTMRVSSSYATSDVTGASKVGGLMGETNGGISTSLNYASGNVIGSGAYVGGLVGYNGFAFGILDSFATGSVTGSTEVGGLVGFHLNGSIDASYATGRVAGTTNVGGLVGYAGGQINSSYATGAVSGDTQIGGLVGRSVSAQISTSYATGLVTGNSNVGGLIGLDSGSAVTNSYWNVTRSGQTTSAGGTGLTDAQMLDTASFAGFNFTGAPGVAGNNWVIVDADGTLNNAGGATGATFPMLASEYSTTITNAHQLQLMAMALAASYTLGGNVDAAATGTSTDVWGNQGFVPVGNQTTGFTGTFNGLNRTINGLIINAPALTGVGLFGFTDTNSVIQNVGLVGGSTIGNLAVGGLAGINAGTISNGYNTGSVFGILAVGGLVGASIGNISDSYSTGSVGGGTYVGGLSGYNIAGTVTNSYATGNVSGDLAVGGLLGVNAGTVSNSYSNGNVSGTDYFGGLIGLNASGTISNSHYDVHNVALNGLTDTYLTLGGLFAAQYQDWFSHGLALNIADYAASLPGSGNNYTLNSVQGLKDLLGFADIPAYTFSQTGNIDLAGETNLHIPYLAGSFDGAGFIISNLVITQPLNNSGLFGEIAATGTVRNVGLFNASVSGTTEIGGLAGKNGGTVSNSYVTGTVNGTSDNVGGLVGNNGGTIDNSYSTASVSGADGTGGLAGNNSGAISNTFATGSVSGAGNSGGLVGYNFGTVSNSYWNADINVTGVGSGTTTGAVGLDTPQMKQQGNFSGWDFTNVWVIYETHTTPLLRSFMTPITVTANNDTRAYDGLAYSGGNGVTYSSVPNSNLLGAAGFSGTSQGAINPGSYVITSDAYSTQQGYLITFVDGALTVTSRLPQITPPVIPGTPTGIPSRPLLDVLSHLESDVLWFPLGDPPETPGLAASIPLIQRCSSGAAAAGDATLPESVDCAVVNIGSATGPRLQIVNGGMRLPDDMVKVVKANE